MIIICPSCERDIAVPRSAISRRAICPMCSESFIVELPRAIVVDETERPLQAAPPPDEPAQETEETKQTEETEETEEAEETEELEEPEWPQETEEADDVELPAPEASQPTTAPHVWYVQTQDGELGPMHIVQVAKAAWMGKIGRKTRLRRSGSDKVIHAGDLPGIFPEKRAPQGEAASSDELTDYLAGMAKQASEPPKVDVQKASGKGGKALADLQASQRGGDDEPDKDDAEDPAEDAD